MARTKGRRGGSRRLVRQGKAYWRKRVAAMGGKFRPCVAAVERHTPMKGPVARGYCANRIREVTGRWPGSRSRK
ncbi:hypothetical protein [Pseudonocardia sp. NPDC049635]|uniref:hypothetical protein n=1 Tax=Pseudonocardia sp. NPDC049635 TaxID=3155506 RepID=UPI0033C9CFE5